MNNHLTELDSTNDPELVSLVSLYIDGQISEEEKTKLEQMLMNNDAAQDYFATQLRMDAEISEHMQPIKVEMTQKRHLVFERKGGIPKIVARESHVTRIGNPDTGEFLELPPGLEDASVTRKRITMIVIGLLALVGALIAILIWQANRPAPITPPATLELRNAGFEETDLSLDESSTNYSVPSWQEFFRSAKARTVAPLKSSSSDTPKEAHSGNNVGHLSPGSFITQRLLYSDNTPLLARKGLHLRVHGWAYVPKQDESHKLRMAIRYVKNIHPEMLQYEPCKTIVTTQSGAWQKFQVDLILPSDSLLLKPSDFEKGVSAGAQVDLDGKAINLSIDNRDRASIFLDDLSIEIIEESAL